MKIDSTAGRSIGRRSLLAGAGGLLATPAIVRAQGANGVALVIGNSKYHWEASLPNVRRDAPDVAQRFEQLGLKTELLLDVGGAGMRTAIDKFGTACRGAKFAAFYFAGHGVFWEKKTYIVPVDADLGNPGVARSLIPVSLLNEAMKDAANRLMVFDSCRNNPADGWRQREAKGLARGDALYSAALAASQQPNTLLLFSTAPGGVALDGPAGENSPFAAALLRQLAGQSIDLQSLPERLRRELLLATECRQLLFAQNTYSTPVALTGRAGTGAAVRHDPSRIVELPNAYAYARENGLVLPAGLVAYRPPASAAAGDRRKIGSYKYDFFVSGGGAHKAPALAIVLSIPDGSSAEVLQTFKSFDASAGGTRWRHITATNSEGSVAWLTIDEVLRLELKWRDQNSGTYSSTPNASAVSAKMASSPFTRIDG
jgi:hypothetical protein